ncbi:DUF350 domain-containing protein [Methylomonas sp. LL1]|uniref:DUF350 domain-containing protein n=1 Tax=Methylomonas sp. LL1 TaxID=2785785 RepID=UPI0018C4203F|nr:DUF350 domain-containing protein [Methylomonas sp. LL1]QPK63988.1 DUF350 domain-containing protein [Methylomonas sp. LL1]CAG1021812.1 hypothetical protein MTYM_01271 [Methylococcales bacterium]
MDILYYVISIIASLALGLLGFILSYKIFDRVIYRMNFGEELKSGNLAVGIFLAGLFIGLGLVVGNAIQ